MAASLERPPVRLAALLTGRAQLLAKLIDRFQRDMFSASTVCGNLTAVRVRASSERQPVTCDDSCAAGAPWPHRRNSRGPAAKRKVSSDERRIDTSRYDPAAYTGFDRMPLRGEWRKAGGAILHDRPLQRDLGHRILHHGSVATSPPCGGCSKPASTSLRTSMQAPRPISRCAPGYLRTSRRSRRQWRYGPDEVDPVGHNPELAAEWAEFRARLRSAR
jgi:hypothetical protein